ncbi:alpha/beta hydrolase family protein [Pseudomonas sp. RL_15y_Pfl2_60]|uniref:alpha/beta hydrolase family protein n=1 Tax=Pseudomonas sp. RL_15y_Pfl2_60 TaxID=3088709 RepID=UPI0030DB0230
MLLRVIFIVLSLLIGPLALAETEPPTPTKTPEKPVERPALGERSQAETAALERQLAANEQQQLKTQASETFLALWRPGNSAPAKGAVILVPGEDESADWPIGIGPLRRKLPDTGWSSLSLSLPDVESKPSPEHTSTLEPGDATPSTETEMPEPSAEQKETPAEATSDPAETAQETATSPADSDTGNDAQKDYATRVLARIAEGISFAQQQGATTVVLAGHGTGAYWAARYLAEQQPPSVSNLLLIAAQAPTESSPDLDALLSELKLATGDFYYKDQLVERNAAKQRLNAAKRQKRTAYIQVAMNSLPGNRDVEQEQLFRRIKGWLSLHLQSSPATQ